MIGLVALVGPAPVRIRITPRRLLASLDRTRSADLWDEFTSIAGNDGVARFRFMGDTCWVVSDPALVRKVLTSPPDVVARSGTFQKLRVFLGDSLITTEGVEHRMRRRQMQPAFHRELLEVYSKSMVAAARATADQWRDGQLVAMEREMAALTMDAIGNAVLGVDGRAEAPSVGAAVNKLMSAMPLMFIPRIENVVLKPVPGLGWVRRAFNTLDAIARRGATDSKAALVESLRVAAAEVPQLSEEEVRDELLTLLIAGYETTSILLTWVWWLLDQRPQVAERLREEMQAVIGDRDPEYADVQNLHQTRAVLAETLRLRPPAWVNERAVVGDLELAGYRPAPGTLLLMPIWSVHRDPRWWDAPEEFRPERWLTSEGEYDEAAPGHPRGAYLPFGAGAHACIGKEFAWTEAALALAVLMPAWRPSVAPGARIGLRATATLRPAHGMPMRLAATRGSREASANGSGGEASTASSPRSGGSAPG
jgi:cytochrome P450